MTPFSSAMAFILRSEGVQSDDPNDPGGFTRFGISQRAHLDVDVPNLTQADAIEIYRSHYWVSASLDRLPGPIAVAAMDACVQHGIRPAIRMLQHTLGVQQDGVVGPVTIAAAERANAEDLVLDYCARRGVYYAHLATFDRFGFGWLRRIFRLAEHCRTLAA